MQKGVFWGLWKSALLHGCCSAVSNPILLQLSEKLDGDICDVLQRWGFHFSLRSKKKARVTRAKGRVLRSKISLYVFFLLWLGKTAAACIIRLESLDSTTIIPVANQVSQVSDSTHGHVSAWYTCHSEEKSSEVLLSSVRTGGILTHVGSDYWIIANVFWSKKMSISKFGENRSGYSVLLEPIRTKKRTHQVFFTDCFCRMSFFFIDFCYILWEIIHHWLL